MRGMLRHDVPNSPISSHLLMKITSRFGLSTTHPELAQILGVFWLFHLLKGFLLF